MRTISFLIVIIFSFNFFAVCQEEDPFVMPQRFNERGFFKSAGSTMDANEIISEFDGNLSVIYNSKIDAPNNMGGDVTVIFNQNVEHRTFVIDQALNQANQSGYSCNLGEWIIGYKGFALQTLNFEVNMYSHPTGSPLIISDLKGEQNPLLIPGYNYTNKIWITQNGLPPGINTYFDYIEILMADGSKKTLYNKDISTNPYSMQDTGTYIEASFDNPGYAVVTKTAGQREMWYKNGDGLTYYFQEEEVHYDTSGHATAVTPKIMYLTEIYSPQGDTVGFEYAYHNFTDLGRKLLKNIYVRNGSTFGGDMLNMVYVETGGDLAAFDLYNGWRNETTRFEIFKTTDSGSPWFSTFRGVGEHNSKVKYIRAVIDPLGRKDIINYQATYKKYDSENGADFDFTFRTPIYLMTSILYKNGKKSDFEYVDHKKDIPYYYIGRNTSENDFLNDSQRDCESNFMMSRRTIYRDYDTKLKTETYSYTSDVGHYILPEANLLDSIETHITSISFLNDDSAPSQITHSYVFSRYRIAFRINYCADNSVIIRKTKEKTDDNAENSKTIITSYDIGDYDETGHYYKGTMWPDTVIVTEQQAGVEKEKMTTYSYQHSQLGITFYQPMAPKYYRTRRTETDPSGIVTDEFYKNYIPLTYLDAEDYFKLGLPGNVTVEKGGLIKKKLNYVYFNNGPKIGMVSSITDQTSSRQKTTSYYYRDTPIIVPNYSSFYPNLYKYHLDHKTDGRTTQKYYYSLEGLNVDSSIFDPGG